MAKKHKIPNVSLHDIEKDWLQLESENHVEEDFASLIEGMCSVDLYSLEEQTVQKETTIQSKSSTHTSNIPLRTNKGQHTPSLKTILYSEQSSFTRKLDMHGMIVRTAYTALLSFIQQSYYANARTVLIITGKGNNSATRKSVLQEAVLVWFKEYPFQEVIKNYGHPHKKHGGEGAIAVLLDEFNRNKIIRWNIYSLSSSLF